MTPDLRKANITIEMLQANVNQLIASLAAVVEERDSLKTQVGKLTPDSKSKPTEPSSVK